MARTQKYTPANLIAAFRLAARARNEMVATGFTDNGGAIHSATRCIDILGARVVYPGLSHTNNLKAYPGAEFSVEALQAHKRGERVFIEHVAPLRALTVEAIDEIETMTDEQFVEFIRARYRLALLTAEETTRLNRHNRSRMADDRLGEIGLIIVRNEEKAIPQSNKSLSRVVESNGAKLDPQSLTPPSAEGYATKTNQRQTKFANTRIFWTGARNGRGTDLLSGGCFILRQVELAGSDGIAFENLVPGERNRSVSIAQHLRYDELRGNIIAVALDEESAVTCVP